MNDSDVVEMLIAEYSNTIDYYFNGQTRRRGLSCSFCRSYKYQLVLNQLVKTHMTHLNPLSERGHIQFGWFQTLFLQILKS